MTAAGHLGQRGIEMTRRRDLPLLYSCSGCSNVAQLANDVAVHLDHQGVVEMSCIAGVGGGVPALVKTARSGRPVIGIDGCPLHCVAQCLAREGVEADRHLKLYEFGYRKRNGCKADAQQFNEVAAEVIRLVGELAAS
ncbi:putative zinc-binding protein [Marinobacterium aestuariivivens]|uniref:Zinc-binding protein n=1 Tax=Marinobacterium aestuariivivens TaxID=1698799 RepID=A0ABW1ZVN4_9GAMM